MPAVGRKMTPLVMTREWERAGKTAFGYHYPNYDVQALARSVCGHQGWQLNQVRFYTGIPDVSDTK